MLKKYQNNPLDFVGATVNEGQRRGMSSAQIGNLVESLGDDLMHYVPMFQDKGKKFIEMIDKLQKAGASLTPEVIDATAKAAEFSNTLDIAGIALSNNFMVGFMKAVGGAKGLDDALAKLNPAAKWLGSEIGDLVKQFGNLVNSVKGVVDWVNKNILHRDTEKDKQNADKLNNVIKDNHIYDGKVPTNPNAPWDHGSTDAAANANASGDKFWNWVSGAAQKIGLVSADSTATTPTITPNTIPSMYQSGTPAVSSTPFNLPTINITLPDIVSTTAVTVDGAELDRVFDAKNTTIFNEGVKRLTLDLNSAQSSTGSD